MNHLRLLLLTTSNLFCSISCVLTVCVLSESSRGIAAGGFAEETIGGFLTHSTLTAQGNFLLLHKPQNINFQSHPFQPRLWLTFKGFDLRKQEKEFSYIQESVYLSRMCLCCRVFADLQMYLSKCTSICLHAEVFVHLQEYLSTCRCICPHADSFVHMQKYLSTCRCIWICRVAETICLLCHNTNRSSWWSTLANHGDIHYTTPTIHWTSPTIR